MALTIYCDESGYTGPNLFLDDQRYFVYASVAISHDQAVDIVAKLRRLPHAGHRVEVRDTQQETLTVAMPCVGSLKPTARRSPYFTLTSGIQPPESSSSIRSSLYSARRSGSSMISTSIGF